VALSRSVKKGKPAAAAFATGDIPASAPGDGSDDHDDLSHGGSGSG
jgi:hypothetical protein